MVRNIYELSHFCRDFLPRGVGIVTRRPLMLHLFNAKDGEETLNYFLENI